MIHERIVDGPGAALWRAANAWQRRAREALEPHGLTPVQYLLLAALGELEGKGPTTQVALARHCATDPMMVSQVVRELESAGLAARFRHAGDARARVLSLTGAGRRRLDAATPAIVEAQRKFFQVLGGDAEAFAGALGVLVGVRPRRRVAAGRS